MDSGVQVFVLPHDVVEPFYLHPLPEDDELLSKHSDSSGFSTVATSEVKSDEESSCSYFYLPCDDSRSTLVGANCPDVSGKQEKETPGQSECKHTKEIENEKHLSNGNNCEKDRMGGESAAKLPAASRNQLCIKVEDLKKVHLRKTADKYNKAASIISELNSSPKSVLEHREEFDVPIIRPPEMFNDDPERDLCGLARRDLDSFEPKVDLVCLRRRCEAGEVPNRSLERFPQEETEADRDNGPDPPQRSNFAAASDVQTENKAGEDEINQLEWLKLYDRMLESEMFAKSSESSEDVPWMSELRSKRKLKKKY